MRRTGWTLPPDDHWETGYEWIVSRAQEAQKAGALSGILFHQGESAKSPSGSARSSGQRELGRRYGMVMQQALQLP